MTSKFPWYQSALAWLFLTGGPTSLPAREPGIDFFERNIRPVLVQNCYECHSVQGKPRGGLKLDSREGIRQGGDSGPALVPGDVANSLIVQALRHDGAIKMPPKGKLPQEVIADFEAWIRMGAPDPRERAAGDSKKYGVSLDEGRKFWAYQAPRKPVVPTPKLGSWARCDADRFVLKALEARGLTPVGDAAPLHLLRRMHIDLIGLPPTVAEISAFQSAWNQDSRKAVEEKVDRLLSLPHFGETWARHWMDVVRYAESGGGQKNEARPYIWQYRDWVIRSINSDKPYDRFLAEQLAGDLLPAESDAARREMAAGTGFFLLGIDDGTFFDQLEEQMTMVGASILGLTVACARCHDHKFDPFSQRDYYALGGIFANIHETSLGEKRDRSAPRGVTDGFAAGTGKDANKAPGLKAKGGFVNLAVHLGGDPNQRGDTVGRGLPLILATDASPTIGDKESGRLQFAQSLASPDHPLTARVAVNRVWARLFGRGIVATVDNLGMVGDKPTHPDLLDFLAVEFREDRWSLKRLVRRLVLSRTYALASEDHSGNEQIDPDNHYLWRHRLRRMEAEAIRDSLLAIGGTLERTPPGGSLSSKVSTAKGGRLVNMPTSNHRSVYQPVVRMRPHDFQTAFDFADPALPVGVRESSTVPTQALYFLNSPMVMDQASRLADRLGNLSEDRAKLEQAYLVVLGRYPEFDEIGRDLAYLQAESRKDNRDPWALFCHALFGSAEFRFVR